MIDALSFVVCCTVLFQRLKDPNPFASLAKVYHFTACIGPSSPSLPFPSPILSLSLIASQLGTYETTCVCMWLESCGIQTPADAEPAPITLQHNKASLGQLVAHYWSAPTTLWACPTGRSRHVLILSAQACTYICSFECVCVYISCYYCYCYDKLAPPLSFRPCLVPEKFRISLL